MDANKPLVSLGLPVYNGENFLAETLESLLAQTYTNFEIIICDNLSTDRTSEICAEFAARDERISYFCQSKNLGAARNFNTTFERSRGKYFKWASHDDLLEPEYLERCVAALEADPDVVICWPHMDHVDSQARHMRNQEIDDLSIMAEGYAARLRQLFDYQIAGDDVIPTIFGLMRRDVLAKTGLWRRYTSSEEILMLELLYYGKVRQLPETLFHFRIHEDSAFHANRTPAEREKWFDTEKHYVLQLPIWFLLGRYYVRVSTLGLPLWVKLRCYYEITRRAVFLWRRYAGDLIKYLGQFVGYRYEYRGKA
ncbi:glycosyltransferase family 2 protein [Granulosicoccaceae sp. 1_MG-2023]|nr:glycosyltransferase family 2 protein [Granulosicoccaceae sp. 1_MG-2023]